MRKSFQKFAKYFYKNYENAERSKGRGEPNKMPLSCKKKTRQIRDAQFSRKNFQNLAAAAKEKTRFPVLQFHVGWFAKWRIVEFRVWFKSYKFFNLIY